MANADSLLDHFIRHLRIERGLSPRTDQTYAFHLNGYAAFLSARGRNSSDAGRADILAYLERRQRQGVQPSTLFGAAIAIRQFHRFLAANGHAAEDPAASMPLPKLRQRLPKPLSEEEMQRLLDRPWGTNFDDVRNRAMIELLYATGMRVSELTSLAADQLDLKDGSVRILGKGGKERIVPVGPRAVIAILRYQEAKGRRFGAAREPLFLSVRGRPLTRGALWIILRNAARSAGLTGRIFPHRIRHSAATHLLAGGADLRVLQELLGHASVVTSQRYTHVTADLLKKTCQKAHPRFR